MLKFSTVTPFSPDDTPEALMNVYPLITPPKGSHLTSSSIKGNDAFIVGKALELAGFYLPCFYDGDISELDREEPEVLMVLPSGAYSISISLDEDNNYLLDLKNQQDILTNSDNQ